MPMRSLLSQLLAVGPELAAFILTSPLLAFNGAHAISPALAPSPNLDISQLGRVAVAGDFDSISVYTYAGQNENFLTNNGSQSLITQFPNGAFASLAQSDAYIESMCEFKRGGKVQGVVVGGNFTSLGGVKAQSVALWDPSTNDVTPLPGLNGPVSALYCDNDSGTVYVGGMFTASHSQNAMAWTTEWSDLPFAGFNGPVNSIQKNSAGNIVFGGAFDGLGNTTTTAMPNSQVVNLAGGDISAVGSSSDAGFSDPRNIICKTGQDGSGNTWLLDNHRGGYWQGTYSFGFIPTKLRLYNTNYQGRGTKTFYFENMEDGGVLGLTYKDNNGHNQTCASNCPLKTGTDAQDFVFTQPIGFNNFRIWISDWYGDGAGFSGIEMFQDDIYSFAINAFNEPNCDGISNAASSTVSPADGLWTRIQNTGTTTSDYLSALLTDASQTTSGTSVVFAPNIPSSGNYSITVYTPGCLADNSCATRGMVNMTGSMTSDKPPVTTTIAQTNDYDKYDQIYFGSVDVDSDTFSPTVTLTPLANQPLPQTIVAQRVRFELSTTTGGLNGLYEYDPNKATVNTDFSKSAIDSAGQNLDGGAIVNSVMWRGSKGYVGGFFSGDGVNNIISIGDKANSLPKKGLNDNVQTMYLAGSMLYVGGNFTNSGDGSFSAAKNVAVFDTDSDEWTPLGAGVDGAVSNLVSVALNITAGKQEDCIAVTGEFTSVNAHGGKDAFDAAGLAIWVPSEKEWLNNIPNANIALVGKMFTQTTVGGMEFPLYAGQVTAETLGFAGAVEMYGSGELSIQSLGIDVMNSDTPSSMKKRAIDPDRNFAGVYTGLFYDDNDLNITILGGNFAASGSNGNTVENLAIISSNDDDKQTVTGISELDSSSVVAALAYQDTTLFAGGSITGTIEGSDINGLVVYDLKKGAVASPQPPALTGDDVVVNAIAPQEDTTLVYVGGKFDAAGSLPCPTICYYDTSVRQWNTPGLGLSGTITSMFWSSKTSLVIAGDLSVRGTNTKMATYDSKKQVFAVFPKTDALPGEITALTPGDSSFDKFWAAGASSSDGTAFLSLYQDDEWNSVSGLGPNTIIRGLQVLSLTDDHDSTDLVPSDEVLMIVGNIHVTGYGNASAVLYNGTTFEPFLLTNKDGNSQGSVSQIFVSNPQALLNMGGNHLAIGFVVLIGLAIALALIFLLVVIGILMERSRRRREGYVPMAADRHTGNLQRIPPETLLGRLGEKSSPSPPKI